jgi:hypothetical protein
VVFEAMRSYVCGGAGKFLEHIQVRLNAQGQSGQAARSGQQRFEAGLLEVMIRRERFR